MKLVSNGEDLQIYGKHRNLYFGPASVWSNWVILIWPEFHFSPGNHIRYQILNICYCFLQAGVVEIIKTNICCLFFLHLKQNLHWKLGRQTKLVVLMWKPVQSWLRKYFFRKKKNIFVFQDRQLKFLASFWFRISRNPTKFQLICSFRFWGLLMFGSYSVCNIIVLLNMLIAMMSTSYTAISERSDVEWKFARSMYPILRYTDILTW